MINPEVKASLEQALSRSDHRSVTIRRDHLAHVLWADAKQAEACKEIGSSLVSLAELARAEGEAISALQATLGHERATAYPFPFLGPWSWPVLIMLAALGGMGCAK